MSSVSENKPINDIHTRSAPTLANYCTPFSHYYTPNYTKHQTAGGGGYTTLLSSSSF